MKYKNPSSPLFFCAIGGSGMMPLACLMRARGAVVCGSDRGRDQGRTPERFAYLEQLGIRLFPQDGSGVTEDVGRVIVSTAVEKTVPDYAAALAQNIPVLRRAELLAEIFNAAETRIAVAGTSGKSTTTGMIGWVLHALNKNPTIINGATMKNFVSPASPFASAVAGSPDLCVAEVDESDGSISYFTPSIAVLNNIAFDHKSLEELRELFTDYAQKARVFVVNLDNPETARMAADIAADNKVTYSLRDESADYFVRDVVFSPSFQTQCRVVDRKTGAVYPLELQVTGEHNLSNALAAIAACGACGVRVDDAVWALAGFSGIARRMDVIGSARGVTVLDDFAHNPDKIAACLRALHAFEGRVLVVFQPHGYGPLKLMRHEFAACFAENLREGDKLFVCDPLYLGGTTDRSVGSADLVEDIARQFNHAFYAPTRDDCAAALLRDIAAGDRVVILGARDDTLPAFARAVLEEIKKHG